LAARAIPTSFTCMQSHLTLDQLDKLRAELERQLKKLQRSMRTTTRAMKPVQPDQSAVGRLSRCVICGEPVAFERLLVFPEAPNCAGCAGR
jgi:hypothetical protein